ncbi:hypothetical protein ASD21_20905 [Caulobacter sp. Root1455]|jgi:hypothetical protein|uniref:hypothetical protein n=1 Tax=Caulobacter sp. Root1455 TaxID=1736465 RepID=UPI00070037E4|nr:hypothetical protein [Caulobacter sp. Root1455]KQZ03264.1 hypothetical protein ASD21_20905 [Caulobacter sp. Root1455]
MIVSILAVSLLLAGAAPQVLDNAGLTTAIQEARETPDDHGQALAGRRFKIILPVVYGDRQNLKTYKSPARWRYDRKKRELEVTVGLGQISSQNYDQFDEQGLSVLPDLQTTYFHVEERKVQTNFEKRVVPGGAGMGAVGVASEAGIRSLGVSYGLATPYPQTDAAGLPSGFKPLMISRVNMDPIGVRQAVDGMVVVVEGEVVPLANGGPLICGKFRGLLSAENVTGDKLNFLSDNQCFVTSNIDRVSVYAGRTSGGKSELLKRWGK